ncbi:MAG: helix-turn-helix domain-containing protein [Candidatus Adiutrix sp.]|jgi:ribosome-binding protein aMBF1 (putative translation factor)|nr:helix-turn-helix domain-containing protein [Candidatus Adiutrix sp.]
MGITDWTEYRKTLNLSPDEEEEIRLETDLILEVAKAREGRGLSQRQLAEACGLPQPVIARLEKATHSPQINTLLRVLEPLGYTLAIVPKD